MSRVSTNGARRRRAAIPADRQQHRLPDDHPQHVASLSAERHADADFLRPLRDRIADDAVNADRGEQRARAPRTPTSSTIVSRRCAVEIDMTSVIVRMSATGTSGSSSCTAAINDGDQRACRCRRSDRDTS